MHKVEKMSSDNIRPIAAEEFAKGTVARTDGSHAYGVAFRGGHHKRQPVVLGFANRPIKCCPGSTPYLPTSKGALDWHTKGRIRSICNATSTNSAIDIIVDSGSTSFSADFSMRVSTLQL